MSFLIFTLGYIAYCANWINWWQYLIVTFYGMMALFTIDRVFWKKMR